MIKACYTNHHDDQTVRRILVKTISIETRDLGENLEISPNVNLLLFAHTSTNFW